MAKRPEAKGKHVISCTCTIFAPRKSYAVGEDCDCKVKGQLTRIATTLTLPRRK